MLLSVFTLPRGRRDISNHVYAIGLSTPDTFSISVRAGRRACGARARRHTSAASRRGPTCIPSGDDVLLRREAICVLCQRGGHHTTRTCLAKFSNKMLTLSSGMRLSNV